MASSVQTCHTTPTLAYFENPIAESYYPNVTSLGLSAAASLELIHSWCSGNLSLDQALVKVVASQLKNYRTAIELSLKIAEDGCTLARDALFTCKQITNFIASSTEIQNDRGHQTTLSHVQTQVNNMLQLAKDAETRSVDAINLFRKVRQELWPLSGGFHTDTGQNNVAVDLDNIISHASVFVSWWTNLGSSLAYLRTVIPQVQPDGENPLRMDSVTSGWKTVHTDYSAYRIIIQEALDKHNLKEPVAGKSSGEGAWKDVGKMQKGCIIM